MKKLLTITLSAVMLLTACTEEAQAQSSSGNSGVQVAQAGGTSAFITQNGEVWAGKEKDEITTYGLIFESNGRVLDVNKISGTWYSQRQNGRWSGNTWNDWALSVNGNILTCSYSYTTDEGEKRTDTVTYTKVTGQNVEIRH